VRSVESAFLFAKAGHFIEFVNDLRVLGRGTDASSIFEWHSRVHPLHHVGRPSRLVLME
jgi:hypothetical protein